MTIKNVSRVSPSHFHSTDSAKIAVVGNKDRIVTPLQTDPLAVHLTEKLPRPAFPSSSASVSETEETLREIGRKTFHYKNSLAPAEAVNWKEKTNRELDIFVQKVSIFAIVNLMDKNIDGTIALEIVNEAWSSHRSALDVYMEKAGNKRSFFQRLFARCCYFFIFRCSIAPNTIDTFMQRFLEIVRTELVQKEGGKNVTTLVNMALSEASSFLDFYLQATENYTNGIDLQGARDVHISRELTKKFGMTEEEICRKFTLTAIRHFLPQVRFFNDSQHSPWRIARIRGFILDNTLGRIVNRLLRKAIEIYIPSVFHCIVKTSIDATQPNNLPFVVSITQGILEQLRKFKSQLEQKQDSPPESPTSVTGTEKLPEVVKKLITVLSKESLQTRKELQQHQESNSFLAKTINTEIEESCIDGCREFFSYLTDPDNSEEIFYLLLNLTNATFESKPSDQKKLRAKYDALQKQMQHEAREVFQMVIHRSVNQRFQGLSESQTKQMTKSFETQQRSRSFETVRHLLINDQCLQSKIAAFQNNLAAQLCIEEELDNMNEAIDSYHNLAVLNDTQKFQPSIQAGIERTMLPVFSRMNALLDQITNAKKLLKHHREEVSFFQEIQKLNALLRNTAEFKTSEYKISIDRLRTLRSQMDSEYAAFDSCLRELDVTYQNLATESQITQDLLSLDQKDGGLQAKLYQSIKARINGKNPICRWKTLPTIPEIQTLEKKERDSLQAYIQAVAACSDLDQLNDKWAKLKEMMTHLFATHRNQQKKLLNKNTLLTQQYIQRIKSMVASVQNELFGCTDAISKSVQTIAQSANEIRIRKVESIPAKIVSAFGGRPATIGAVAGASLSAIVTFLPKAIAYPILGTFTALATCATWYAGQEKLSTITAAGGAGGIAIGAATYFFPQMNRAIPLLTGAAGGYWEGRKLEKAIPAFISNNEIFPPVMKVFDNLYDFILKPHVWKWAIVDTIKCVHEAYQ